MDTLRVTYYPDITQKQDPDAMHRAVGVFAEALGAELTRQLGRELKGIVPPVMSVAAQYDDILAGTSAVALMKPVAYVFAHRQDKAIVPACVAHRPIDGVVGTFYFAQLYARRELGIRNVSDLLAFGAGRLRIAYGDRFSTSNFLVPASMLSAASVHPFLHFRQVTFAGGHDRAAEQVYDGLADVGAGHDGVISILEQSRPDAADKLVRLAHENIHSDPVVVNTRALPPGVRLEDIQRACTAIAKTKPVQDALDLFWGWVRDLSSTEHANYQSIEQALSRLHLQRSDMIT